MVWWLHLIIREKNPLKHKCELFERVVRAVGSFPYVERAVPSLLCKRWGSGDICVDFRTVNEVLHRGYDLPARVCRYGLWWVRKGRGFRDETPDALWIVPTPGLLESALLFWASGEEAGLLYHSHQGIDPSLKMTWELLTRPRKDHVSGRTP